MDMKPRSMGTSHLAINAATALAECTSADAEFKREFEPFCKLLDITPAMLEKMPVPTLLLLVNMRLFKLLSTKLREIDDRTAAPPSTEIVQ